MKTRQENVVFLAWFDKFKVHFCEIIDMYEHYSYKKDVWTEYINGIESVHEHCLYPEG